MEPEPLRGRGPLLHDRERKTVPISGSGFRVVLPLMLENWLAVETHPGSFDVVRLSVGFRSNMDRGVGKALGPGTPMCLLRSQQSSDTRPTCSL
jgi:hypothetical protein